MKIPKIVFIVLAVIIGVSSILSVTSSYKSNKEQDAFDSFVNTLKGKTPTVATRMVTLAYPKSKTEVIPLSEYYNAVNVQEGDNLADILIITSNDGENVIDAERF